MAKPHIFSEEQLDILYLALERAAANKKRWKKQEDLALALDITQPSLSSLLHRKWRPGESTAKAIANLSGRTLEDMIGPYEMPEAPPSVPAKKGPGVPARFPNLTACIAFYAGSRAWSPWTIAAAEAGFFGEPDFLPPDWAAKLDILEKVLERTRKAP